MREVLAGICGNHYGARLLCHKIVTQGYYWPTMLQDAQGFVKACDPCQQYAPIPRQPLEPLTSIVSPWHFAQ